MATILHTPDQLTITPTDQRPRAYSRYIHAQPRKQQAGGPPPLVSGRILKSMRAAFHFKAPDVALHLDCASQTIYEWEHGQAPGDIFSFFLHAEEVSRKIEQCLRDSPEEIRKLSEANYYLIEDEGHPALCLPKSWLVGLVGGDYVRRAWEGEKM